MAVPERRARVEKLLATLKLDGARVTWDVDHEGHVPSWWRAMSLACQPPATHALILEDDAEPCEDFLAAVEKIVTKYPERVVSFFTVNRTLLPDTQQLTLVAHNGFSDVAVVYPVAWLESLKKDFVLREQELRDGKWQAGYGADELRMKLRPTQKIWATHPSLVQHGSPNQSTLGHHFPRSTAQPCLSVHNSALALDWSHL